MNLLCVIFGHKPFSPFTYGSFKLLGFHGQNMQNFIEVSVCERCRMVYASKMELSTDPVLFDLEPKIINI